MPQAISTRLKKSNSSLKEFSWARVVVQSVRCSGMVTYLVLTIHIKSQPGWPVLGKRSYPGTQWWASLAYFMSSRPVRDPVSKSKLSSPQEMTPASDLWPAHSCTHTYMCTHLHNHMCTPPTLHTQVTLSKEQGYRETSFGNLPGSHEWRTEDNPGVSDKG